MVTTTSYGGAIPQLTRWGLSPDADLAYRALTMSGSATPSELARSLGMPGARVRSALDELASAGAARPGTARHEPGRAWTPVPVGQVLTAVRRRRHRVTSDAERWRGYVATLSGAGLSRLRGAAVRRWPTRAATRQRVAELTVAERHEHLTVNTEWVFDSEAMAAALPLDRSIIARGIKLRMIGHPPADGDRSSWYAAQLGDIGGLFRQADELPCKMMIFDRRVAVVPVNPLDLEAGYVEIGEPAVVAGLCGAFERLWHTAVDPCRTGVAPLTLTVRERELVELLAAGHTDHAAAARLRVSPRTVSYTLRALSDRLGVENRFQLGLALGAAGAVSVPPAAAPPAVPPTAAPPGAVPPATPPATPAGEDPHENGEE
jgi:DNA-binding CsgD family transcriptional regulator